MKKTLWAGLLLLSLGLWAQAAPPPETPTPGENGVWDEVTVQGKTQLKVFFRGQKLSIPAYSTSLGDEYLIAGSQPELRQIARAFAAELEWDESDQKLRCTQKGVQRSIQLGERRVQSPGAAAGNETAELPLAAQNVDGKTHVPLSALEEFLQIRVTARPNSAVYLEPLLREVRFEGSAKKPRLVLETTAPVQCKTFTLKNPDRFVIDIPGAVIDTPSLTVQHPHLGNVRLGQFELGPAITRVVVPTLEGTTIKQESWGARESFSWQLQLPKQVANQPEQLDISEVKLEKTPKGHRLILSANEAMRYEWMRVNSPSPKWWLDIPGAVLKDPKQEFAIEGKFPGVVRVSQNQPLPNPVVRLVVDLEQAVEVATSAGENERQLVIDILDKELELSASVPKGSGSTAQAALTGTGLIVIDPGHGGSDPGAYNKTLKLSEASVTLDICRRLAQILKAQGWNVVMTRNEDVDVSYWGSPDREELGARVKVANESKADLFVSVHCNASVSPSSNGTSLHYYKKADYELASSLQQALLSSTGRSNRGLRADRLYVLAHSQMPAVLVETAFLTNPTEGALLGDPAYRQKIAEGLAQGLRQYASRQPQFGTAAK